MDRNSPDPRSIGDGIKKERSPLAQFMLILLALGVLWVMGKGLLYLWHSLAGNL